MNETALSGFDNPKHVTKRGMRYVCESCYTSVVIWLEKGLCEGGETHKPVPMFAKCPCCGEVLHGMRHVGADVFLNDYRPIEQDECFFLNDPKHDCGIPVFYGFEKTVEDQLEALSYSALREESDYLSAHRREDRERLKRYRRDQFKKGRRFA